MQQVTPLETLREKLLSTTGVTILVTLALIAAVGIHRGPYLVVNTIVTGGMLAMVSMGLALVFGVMNIAQFAHGEYFMIGTLTAFHIFTPLQERIGQGDGLVPAFAAPFVAILGAMAVGTLVGTLTEILVFRKLRERSAGNWVMNSFLVTVGLSVILINGHQLLFGSDFKGITRYWSGAPVTLWDLFISRDRAMALFIAAVTVSIFWAVMKYSRVGRAIRAVSQDEAGALIVGISLDGIQVLTMALACGLAAMAGATLLFIYPSYPTVGLEPLYMAWFVVILAGLGNILGAVICAFIVALLKVATIEYIGTGWDFVVPTALIMLMLIVKPSGIFGSVVRGIHDE